MCVPLLMLARRYRTRKHIKATKGPSSCFVVREQAQSRHQRFKATTISGTRASVASPSSCLTEQEDPTLNGAFHSHCPVTSKSKTLPDSAGADQHINPTSNDISRGRGWVVGQG